MQEKDWFSKKKYNFSKSLIKKDDNFSTQPNPLIYIDISIGDQKIDTILLNKSDTINSLSEKLMYNNKLKKYCKKQIQQLFYSKLLEFLITIDEESIEEIKEENYPFENESY